MTFLSIRDADFWGRTIADLEGAEIPLGLNISSFVLGHKKDNAPVARALRMEPGFILLRHAHECFRFEVVVQGTLDVGDRILKVGDIMLSEPGVFYGPNIAGPDGCTTIEIFSTYDASHTLLVEQDGEVKKFDTSCADDLAKVSEHAKSEAAALKPVRA